MFKKILLTVLFLGFGLSQVYAACGGTCYAKTAGGNWSSANTWSSTSAGGADNSGPPTATDNVIFELLSGNVTIDAAAAAKSVNMTSGTGSYTGTLTHNSGITLSIGTTTAGAGNVALKFNSGATYTLGSVTTSVIAFVSTSSTQQTIDYAGLTAGNDTFTGAAQNYAFTSAINTGVTSTWTVTGGALAQYHFDGASDNSGLTHSIGLFLAISSNTNTFYWGNSTIGITGQLTVWNMSGSANVTCIAGTSNLNSTGNRAAVSLGNVNCAYNNVHATIGTGTETNGGTYIQLGGGTVANVTVTGQDGPDDRYVLTGGGVITTSWTVTGATSITHKITIWPNSEGNTVTATYTGPSNGINFTYCDIQDVAFVSANNIDFTGVTDNGAVGDIGGNSISGGGQLKFLTPTTQHWISATGGNWDDITKWTSRIPLAQDNVVLDAAFTGSQTITAGRKWLCRDLDFTGHTGTPTLQGDGVTSSEKIITGSITLTASGMLWTQNSSAWYQDTRKASTFKSNGFASMPPIFFLASHNSVTFLDNIKVGSPTTFYGGTMDFATNNVNLTTGAVQIQSNNAGNATTWNMGNGTTTLTSTGNIFFPSSGTEATNYPFLTVNAGGSTIAVTNVSASSKTFKGYTFHWNNLTVTGGGAGALIFSDGSTWNNLPQVTGGTETLTFTAGTTNTFINGTSFGNGTNVVTINSSSGGNPATLTKAAGQDIVADYLSISDSTATGGVYWFAGANSTNTSGNTGWIFQAGIPGRSSGGGGTMKMGISI